MTVKHVKPGDRVRRSARDHNAMADAVNWVAAHRQREASGSEHPAREPDRVWLWNTECEDWQRFECLQITDPVTDPTDALEAWANGDASFHARTPDASHGGRVAILTEPVEPCGMGRAIMSGVVQTRISISQIGHRFARPNGRQLASTDDPTAPCQILWPLDRTGDVYAVVRISNGGGSGETTTTAAATSTTPPPCSGSCKWTWSEYSATWVLDSDGCGPGTSTTPAPTSSTAATSTSAAPTTSTCACGTTTGEPSTTTTPAPCGCTYPSFCGASDGECTYTNCSTLANYPPACGSTTTPDPATSTTCDCDTTTTPSGPGIDCSTGCDWVGVPTPAGTWGWRQTSNGCSSVCPCPAPEGDPFCATDHTGCIYQPPPPPPPPPPGCGGSCTYWWVPSLGQWVLTANSCAQVANCNCMAPSIPGDLCAPAIVPCGAPITTSPPTPTTLPPCAECYTSSTWQPTTTTPNPCAAGSCRWQGASDGSWSLVANDCPSSCPCQQPSYAAREDCEVALSPCAGTTTTQAPTTTTPKPCGGNCIYVCSDLGGGSYGWALNSSDCDGACPPGNTCGCSEMPIGPCEAGSVGSPSYVGCGCVEVPTTSSTTQAPTTSSSTSSTTAAPTTSSSTSSTTSTTPCPCTGNCTWYCNGSAWVEQGTPCANQNGCGDCACSNYPEAPCDGGSLGNTVAGTCFNETVPTQPPTTSSSTSSSTSSTTSSAAWRMAKP